MHTKSSPSSAPAAWAELYRGSDTRLDRLVAIKILPAVLAGDAGLRDRFEREARAISSLSRPHICALFDVGRHKGTDFLVLEHGVQHFNDPSVCREQRRPAVSGEREK